MPNITLNNAKNYMKGHNILALMLAISQSSANYVLAMRFYVLAIQLPARWIVDKLLPESFFEAETLEVQSGAEDKSYFNANREINRLIKGIAEFAVATFMVFVVSSFSKQAVRKLDYVVQIQPTGFYSDMTAYKSFDNQSIFRLNQQIR